MIRNVTSCDSCDRLVLLVSVVGWYVRIDQRSLSFSG